MGMYKVDRELLESYPTEEILRILRKERDDYTDEAIRVFEEILQSRGARFASTVESRGPEAGARSAGPTLDSGEALIRVPADAKRVLNQLLSGLLDGSVPPEVAQVGCTIVMGILRAMEQEFMTDSGEGA